MKSTKKMLLTAFQKNGLAIMVAALGFTSSVIMIPYDEYLASVGTESEVDENSITVWRWLSAARAAFSSIGWILLAAQATLPYNFMASQLVRRKISF